MIDIDSDDLFMSEMLAVMGLITVFLLILATGTPEKLTNLLNSIMRTERYGSEVSKCSPYHILVGFISVFRNSVGLLLFLCSTIFVVPVFKVCIKAVACDASDDNMAYLSADPSIRC